jgi:hypothetical protein
MRRKCWVSRLSFSPLGFERVHLLSQLVDMPPRCLVTEVAFAPLMGLLELVVVARSTDPAGWSAKGMASWDGRKLLLRV